MKYTLMFLVSVLRLSAASGPEGLQYGVTTHSRGRITQECMVEWETNPRGSVGALFFFVGHPNQEVSQGAIDYVQKRARKAFMVGRLVQGTEDFCASYEKLNFLLDVRRHALTYATSDDLVYGLSVVAACLAIEKNGDSVKVSSLCIDRSFASDELVFLEKTEESHEGPGSAGDAKIRLPATEFYNSPCMKEISRRYSEGQRLRDSDYDDAFNDYLERTKKIGFSIDYEQVTQRLSLLEQQFAESNQEVVDVADARSDRSAKRAQRDEEAHDNIGTPSDCSTKRARPD